LSFLRTSPQFQQLRQVVQTQPHLLQPLLQQLGASNPQLLQMINQNQDAFMQLLMEGGDMEGEDDIEGGAPGVQYIQLTPEENEAVNRVTIIYF
jgi:UV excision repair protein RAD23